LFHSHWALNLNWVTVLVYLLLQASWLDFFFFSKNEHLITTIFVCLLFLFHSHWALHLDWITVRHNWQIAFFFALIGHSTTIGAQLQAMGTLPHCLFTLIGHSTTTWAQLQEMGTLPQQFPFSLALCTLHRLGFFIRIVHSASTGLFHSHCALCTDWAFALALCTLHRLGFCTRIVHSAQTGFLHSHCALCTDWVFALALCTQSQRFLVTVVCTQLCHGTSSFLFHSHWAPHHNWVTFAWTFFFYSHFTFNHTFFSFALGTPP
jgi:hypothetical protein